MTQPPHDSMSHSTSAASAVWNFFLGICILSIAVSTGLLCLVPPTSRDALIHHLALPKLFLQAGSYFELPCMVYSYYPMTLDVLYGLALALGPDIMAKFIHWGFGLMTAILIYQYLKNRLSPLLGLAGAALFLSLPVVVRLSTTAYVDLGLMFFSFASLCNLMKWYEGAFRLKHIIWAGVYCGLAMGTKYNGFICFALTGLLVPWLWTQASEKCSKKRLGTAVTVFILTSGLVYSPWGVRNMLWTGNPVYPLYENLRSEPYDPSCINAVKLEKSKLSGISPIQYRRQIHKESWTAVALLPLRIFFQGEDNNAKYFDGRLSPLLFFLPLLAVVFSIVGVHPLGTENRALLLFSVFYIIIALLTSVVRVRYLGPAIPPLVVLSMVGINGFLQLSGVFGRLKGFIQLLVWLMIFGMGILGLGSCIAYIYGQYELFTPLSYLSGQIDKEDYLEKRLPETPCMNYINSHLPADAKILYVYMGKRGYYCDRAYVPDRGSNLNLLYALAIQSRPDHDRVGQIVMEQGISHLLVNEYLARKQMNKDLTLEYQKQVLKFMSIKSINLFRSNGISLYQLR